MAYKILIAKEAKNDILKLDAPIQKQLHKKLLYIASLQKVSTVAKKLTNFDTGEYRLRMGNYRVIFDLEPASVIVILRVQHRKDVYR